MAPQEQAEHRLPKFDRPPVVEAVVGVEFLPLPGVGPVRLAELRNLWVDEFPEYQELPALRPTQIELSPAFEFIVGAGSIPPLRLWMLTKDGDRLLQLQNDRLVLNWRSDPHAPFRYPSYAILESQFQKHWQTLLDAAEERRLGAVQPLIAEVTYVNEFTLEPDEDVATAVRLLSPQFPYWGRTDVSLNLRSGIEPIEGVQGGHRAIALQSHSQDPGKLRLSNTVKVALDSEPGVTDTALDYAHVCAVEGFADITTEQMHERWGRTQ